MLAAFNNPQVLLSPQAQTDLIRGIHSAFLLSLVLMLVRLVAVFFLKEIELRGRGSRARSANTEDSESASMPARMH